MTSGPGIGLTSISGKMMSLRQRVLTRNHEYRSRWLYREASSNRSQVVHMCRSHSMRSSLSHLLKQQHQHSSLTHAAKTLMGSASAGAHESKRSGLEVVEDDIVRLLQKLVL